MTGFDNSHAKQITSSYVGGGGADGSSATINGGGIGSKRYLPLLMFLIAMGSWMMGHNSFMSPPPSCNSVMKEVTTLRTVQRDETNAQPNETDILSQASTATSVDDFSTVAATDSITGPLLKGFLSEEKLQLFQQAKQRLIDQLKSNDYYGSEHFTNLFVDQETGMFRTLFPINDTNSQSYKRFVRKIMIKLLKAASTNTVLPFVWVTSGNSVGAGHGNLFNESYSSIVQKSLHETMSTLNLDLTVRPYAMSASRSAPELAFCQSEVYGQDIDLLVWHFGLTDMLETERMALFLYRMGLLDYATQNDNRPVMMALQIGTARRDVVESIARMGLCILQNEDKDILKLLKDGVPDTFGMTEEQINAMPPYIRNFKCDKRIEEGDPYCSSDKYTLNLCPERLYQTSWHPGWYVFLDYFVLPSVLFQ